jgi:hypothetical protein
VRAIVSPGPHLTEFYSLWIVFQSIYRYISIGKLYLNSQPP